METIEAEDVCSRCRKVIPESEGLNMPCHADVLLKFLEGDAPGLNGSPIRTLGSCSAFLTSGPEALLGGPRNPVRVTEK